MSYKKLVRDKIPEIIESNGEKPITRILNDVEYNEELIKKLNEEYHEVGFGYVKDLGSKCENHYAVVDSNGEVISDYAKIHPFSAGYESKYFLGGLITSSNSL